MLRKMSLLVLSIIIIFVTLPTQAFASNHQDKPYNFTLSMTNDTAVTKSREKNNTTSTYVKIDNAPSSIVLLDVEGFRPTHISGKNVWVNETIGGTQVAQVGQWLVRQFVYENDGRSARLKFQKYSTASGRVSGVWSPDSVGTYPILN